MKRIRVIGVVVVVLLMGWLMIHFSEPKEPSYQGRRLSELLDTHSLSGKGLSLPSVHDSDYGERKEAINAIGTNAIPTLLTWVRAAKTQSTQMRDKLNTLLAKQSFLRFRFRTPVERLWMADCCFEMLGTNALPAVPALVRLLQSSEMYQRQSGIDALTHIAPDKGVLLPLLLPLLHGSDEDARFRAAFCLDQAFPEEAERVGVYEMFPKLKRPSMKALETKLPPPNK